MSVATALGKYMTRVAAARSGLSLVVVFVFVAARPQRLGLYVDVRWQRGSVPLL